MGGCNGSDRTKEIPRGSITTYEEFFAKVASGAKLIVLDDAVIDINSFEAIHPGGKDALEKYVGMEVSRFFYGGFQMPGKELHFHESSAYKLAKNMVISTIANKLASVIFRPIKAGTPVDLEHETWKLVSKKPVSAVHSVFQFENKNLKVAAMLPYFDHCGKYYTLTSTHLKMSRNLACIFTPSDSMVPHYLKLLGAFTKGEAFTAPFPDINNVQKDYLELYLKKLNVFSTFLHDFPIENPEAKGIKNEFQVRGPYGPGIGVEPNQKGTIVGVACGTGVVLFLDLAMYILRMNIYNAGKKLGKDYKMFANETFDRLTDPSFKLVIFSAFKKQDHVLAEPLFRALHDISAKNGFNNFEYHLRVSEKTEDPKWDEAYFRKNLDLNAKKIVVYGPLGAEESIKDTMRKLGVKDSQFHRI